MFGTLIESRAVRQRHTAGSLASILIHSAVITAGVIATARDMVTMAPESPVDPPLTFVRPMDPPPATSRPVQVSTASVAPVPLIQRLTMPALVPVGIPPIDLTVSPTQYDVDRGPIGPSRILCDLDCSPRIVTDSAGRELWNSRDVMMRLLEEPVPPRYPESLRRAGIEGDVVVKFVVDTTGRVEMRTIEVMRSTHGAFTDAVRETLARLRFAPGAVGERKVRALAVMPFHFTLKE
jgi:periplasmic protein TonB